MLGAYPVVNDLQIHGGRGTRTGSITRDARYDVLFEPVRIGPVTAPNRFYQVPHASGMTNALPRVRAAFRGTKAEGGWGVICTGVCSIDASSDDTPLPFATLWDRNDIRAHAMMTEAVHRHGALAGVELWHGGAAAMNRASRLPPLAWTVFCLPSNYAQTENWRKRNYTTL